jgi:hypothetical protein
MKNFGELDGVKIDMDGVAVGDISFHGTKVDTDDFYPADGVDDITNMVALSAAQNIRPGIYDGDNFYPADGEYSEARGRFKGTIFDKRERAKRRAVRQKRTSERQSAKNEETRSRAELNRQAGKESPADAELAKVLSGSAIPGMPSPTDTAPATRGMSRNTKIMIGVGIAVVLGIVGVVLYKRYKN